MPLLLLLLRLLLLHSRPVVEMGTVRGGGLLQLRLRQNRQQLQTMVETRPITPATRMTRACRRRQEKALQVLKATPLQGGGALALARTKAAGIAAAAAVTMEVVGREVGMDTGQRAVRKLL